MSKGERSRDDKAVISASQARHQALGWSMVILPGGRRRMMTRPQFEAWKAAR